MSVFQVSSEVGTAKAEYEPVLVGEFNAQMLEANIRV